MIRKYGMVNPANQDKCGIVGPRGNDGNDGADGPTGPTGPCGPRGPGGSRGAPGVGITDELISKIQDMEQRIKQLEDMIKKSDSK